MRKITFFSIFILSAFYINLTYSDLNKPNYDKYQPNYCDTLTTSKATTYDFYKCAYYKEVREKNKVNTPSQAELEKKRYQDVLARERQRNAEIAKETDKAIEKEWQSRMDKQIAEYQKIIKSIELIDKWTELAQKSSCVNAEECINAIYLYKESLSLNYRDDVYNAIDNLYLMLAAQYNMKNEYNNAIKYALLSKNTESLNDLLVTSYNGLALDYQNNKDYEKAIEYGLLAMKKMENSNNPKLWLTYTIIWESFLELKKYNEAIYYFNKVLEYNKDVEIKKSIWNYIKYSEQELAKENKWNWFNSCWIKSIEDNNWNCVCEKWYIWESTEDLKNLNCKKIEIPVETPTETCQKYYWINSYSDWVVANNWWYNCYCTTWYEWNKTQTSCEAVKWNNKVTDKFQNKALELFSLLEKKTLNYKVVQKIEIYKKVKSKATEIKNKINNQDTKKILEYLIVELNNYIETEEKKINDLFGDLFQ